MQMNLSLDLIPENLAILTDLDYFCNTQIQEITDMQGDKKEKPKDEKKKKNKYIVKDGDGNIMDVEVPESWIKILEAMNKGEKKK